MATTAEPQPANTQEGTNRPTAAKGWGTDAPDQPLRPMDFERRALRPDDVAIKITFAGICRSDLHTCRNDRGGTNYPVDPRPRDRRHRHRVGSEVTRHQVGDPVAVGCMVDSCMECDQCLAGWEVFCRKGCVQTYNSADDHDGTISKGGYTEQIVVREHFVFKVPAGMDSSAPRRCFAPGSRRIRRCAVQGWRGHQGRRHRARRARPHGRQLAAAMGAHVTMITTTPRKGRGRPQAGRARRDHFDRSRADGGLANAVRLHPQHHPGGPRDRPLSPAARPVGPNGDRRSADADAGLRRVQADLVESGGRRVGHRRNSRDPGDAGFLRRAWHLSRIARWSASTRSTRPMSGCSRTTSAIAS